MKIAIIISPVLKAIIVWHFVKGFWEIKKCLFYLFCLYLKSGQDVNGLGQLCLAGQLLVESMFYVCYDAVLVKVM